MIEDGGIVIGIFRTTGEDWLESTSPFKLTLPLLPFIAKSLLFLQ